jgi:4-aminobutyrate aminotransferase
MGGVIARAEVMDSLGANSISTFGGNPLAAAGALANLDYLLAEDLPGNARRMGERLRAGIDAAASDCPAVAEVRGKGLMLGVEFVVPGTLEPDAAAAGAVLEHARANGLLLGRGGLYGNVIRITPPMSVTADEVDRAIPIVAGALAAL